MNQRRSSRTIAEDSACAFVVIRRWWGAHSHEHNQILDKQQHQRAAHTLIWCLASSFFWPSLLWAIPMGWW